MGQKENQKAYQSRVHPDNIPNKPFLGLGSFGDLGPGEPALSEWKSLGLPLPNVDAMRRYRLDRLRQKLNEQDCGAILLFDPMNVRYATDSTNMQLWCTHNAVRYALIFAEGPVMLWDFHGCEHLSSHLPLVDEVRNAKGFFYFAAGHRGQEISEKWGDELHSLMLNYMGGNKRLAVDKVEPLGNQQLTQRGWQIVEGQALTETARSIKGPDELKAMRCAIAAAEAGIKAMQQALKPGVSEQELWSVLHAENILRGGEWIETRLLASGPRTNPWFQECSSRIIENGDIVAFDTDLVGPYGYMCDISRTWLAGDKPPTLKQRDLYAFSREHIARNLDIIKPGMSFLEFSEKSFPLREAFIANRYSLISHGVGMCDEWPGIYYPIDNPATGYDGEIKPGMTMTMESLIGEEGGRECVKLEEQFLVTEEGIEVLSSYPWEDERFGYGG